MPQDRYVLIHQDGQFLSINDGNHWICVPDPSAATVLSETKANNILQNMIKPKERENWRLHPLAALAGSEQPVVENIPQEEVRTVTENGVNRRVVPGIDDAIRRAFEESRLVDTRDFAWAVPGEPFALAGYRGFTGRLIKNSK